MGEITGNVPFYARSPLFQLFVSLLIVISVGVVLFTLSMVAGIFIFDVKTELLQNPSSAVSPGDISFLRYMLISQDVFIFILPSLLIMRMLKLPGQKGFIDVAIPGIKDVLLVVLLAFCIFPVTGFTGYLNSQLQLPDWLSGIQQWITDKEDSASDLFDIIMKSGSLGVLMINIVMIAILPAIGEEFLFRGVLQKLLCRLIKSDHLAIWFTAFIFSFFHFQFFGFVPRLILGLVFGYLFYWSGTLWLPIAAHFINNAVPTIQSYIEGYDSLNGAVDGSVWQQLLWLPVPLLVSILILSYFHKKWKDKVLPFNEPHQI